MKNFEQYKRIVRFTSVISLIFCEMVIYWVVWLKHYNIEMEIPYNRTGNWMIVAVYGLIHLSNLISMFYYSKFDFTKEEILFILIF